MMTANADGSILVGLYNRGLFVLRDGLVTPVTGAVNEFLKAKLIKFGLRLRDGRLLIGTTSGGVILLDEKLQFRDRWGEGSGLQNETLWNALEDREGGLWLCLDVGVSRVEPSDFVSVFDADNGLKHQSVYDAARLHGSLIVATGTGLFRIVEGDPATLNPARCERVPGAGDFCINLCPVDQGLPSAAPLASCCLRIRQQAGCRRCVRPAHPFCASGAPACIPTVCTPAPRSD